MANSYNLYKVESFKAKRYTLQSSNPMHPSKERVNYHHNFYLTLCYGKIYRFFCVVVIRNIFARKLSHLAISSPFILVNQKMYKTTVAFGIDFCCYSLSSYEPACRHFWYLLLVSFKVNISVNGLSGKKIGFHGS